MKRFYAINGSPRTDWNTAKLLDKALEGTKSEAGSDVFTERIDLYGLNYTGCRSCFACKRKGGNSYGKCAVRDELFPILGKIADADGVIIGSPIYYRNITGQLHSFYERMLFPHTVYSTNRDGIEERNTPFGFIYTMNVTKEEFLRDRYEDYLRLWEIFSGNVAGRCYAFNIYQFDDYSKYVSDWFSESEKAAYKKSHWETDCNAAYELGAKIAGYSKGE